MFLWPADPVPHAVGDPIVVELVAAVPQGGEEAPNGETFADNGAPADDSVPLTVQADLGSIKPPPDAAAERPAPAVDVAALTEPPEMQPPASVPAAATVEAVPFRAVSRPPRKPAAPSLEGGEPSATDIEAPPAPHATHGDQTTAAIGGLGDTGGELAAATVAGPRFAVGSPGNPLPRYPLAARRRGLEGRVVLRVHVDPDGRARQVEVRIRSLHPMLDDAAVATLRRWRFEPARRAGVPVAAWVEVPINFRLND
jgi:protein TonB